MSARTDLSHEISVLFLEELPAGAVVRDETDQLVFVNRSLRALAGPADWVGRTFGEVFGEKSVLAAAAGGGILRTRTDHGEERALRIIEFPIGTSDGRRLTCSLLEDVTEALRECERLQGSIVRWELFTRELHHRIKNNFATVASLLSLEAGTQKGSAAAEVLETCEERVKAMALIHEELCGSRDVERLNFGDYLKRLTERLVAVSLASRRVRLAVDIVDLELPMDTAVPLGLIANELVTNALKYAFPARKRRSLRVSLRQEPGSANRATVIVSDDGPGLPDGFDPRLAESTGLQLVQALTEQVNGELEFVSSSGTTCRLSFPVPTERLIDPTSASVQAGPYPKTSLSSAAR